ncbi:hypothetical protein [Vibrio astriarenae]|uniref:hypothetical protein n=1 Tax=Vibrio astriarenae TaxID=1481923 RepID=UPI00373516F6
MKKTLLALAVATTALTFGAQATDVNPDGRLVSELKDLTGAISPIDMNQYKNMASGLDTTAEKVELAKKIVVAETSTNDLIKYVANNNTDKKEQMIDAGLITMTKHGVITVNEDHAHYGTIDTKRDEAWANHVENSFNDGAGWIDENGNLIDKDLSVGTDPVEGDLYFTEDIPTICGVEIDQSTASIRFENDLDEDIPAKVTVKNNSSVAGTFKIRTVSTSLTDTNKISYEVNENNIKSGGSTPIVGSIEGSEIKIYADYAATKSQVNAGNAEIAATIEYECN